MEDVTHRLPGRPAKYRGEVPKAVRVYLTPEGHAALAEGMAADKLSVSDYVEKKLRRARPQPSQDADDTPESPEI